MQVIREIAKTRGVLPVKLGKIELVRTLQGEEVNFDCFARAYTGYCDQSDCLWLKDCLSLSKRHGKDS